MCNDRSALEGRQLIAGHRPEWRATLAFERPAHDRLIPNGEIDGRKLQMRLELFPREKFLLVSRGFNWVQEYPFNR